MSELDSTPATPAEPAKPAAKPAKPAKAAKPVAVEFLKSHALYNKGEVAGFPKQKADWLIEKKLAILASKA